MLSLSEFLKAGYRYNGNRYNPDARAQDIVDVIYSIKRDGLKVILKNNNIYIENTVSKSLTQIHFSETGSVQWEKIR